LIPTCLCTKLGQTWARLGLMTAAKRRAIDSFRRGRMLVQKREDIARELEWQQQQLGDALEHSLDQVIDHDLLRLIFTACHPVLTAEARITFTLRLIFAE
jgi:RNA polymerase sigma-70 factor, ECF subfamily